MVHQSHTHRAVPAAMTTEDGTTVRLDLEHVEVVGAPSTFYVRISDVAEPTRPWAAAVPSEAQGLTFSERILPASARVVVSGIARVVDATVDPNVEGSRAGYRDGVPVEKRTFVIGGSPDVQVLVAEGSAGELLWRASWPVAVLVATGLAGLTYAGILFALLIE